MKRVHVDRAGLVRVATVGGVYRFDPRDERFGRDPTPVGEVVVNDILETRGGALWFATDDGAVRVDQGTTLRIGLAEGLPMAGATALAEGPEGEVWIGTPRGLSRHHQGRLSTWIATGAPRSTTRGEGAPSGGPRVGGGPRRNPLGALAGPPLPHAARALALWLRRRPYDALSAPPKDA